MPGILSGLVKGLEANRQSAMDQQRLNLEQQRVGLEQQRSQLEQQQTERQNRRQDLQDQLAASQDEINGVMTSAAPDRAVVTAAPAAPTGTKPTDPKLAQQWEAQQQAHENYVNSDQYKAAVDNIQKLQDPFREAAGRHRALLGKLAGEYTGEINDEAERTKFNLAHSGLDGVSRRQFVNYLVANHRLPPEGWLKGQNGEPSAYDQAALQLYDGLQTGNWDGKEQAVSMLMPELHLSLGQQMPNGNTVVGNQASHLFFDPKDPNYLHVSNVVIHTDGKNVYQSQSPHMADGGMRIPLSVLGERMKDFFGTSNLMHNPVAQQKLRDGLANGDSAMHDFMRIAGAAGVPPPQRSFTNVSRGAVMVETTPGSEGRVVAQGQQFETGAERELEKIKQDIRDENPDMPADEVDDRAERTYRQSRYGTGLSGGGSAGGGAGGGKVKVGDRKDAVNTAIDALGDEFGYHKSTDQATRGRWVNEDGDPITVDKDPEFHKRLNRIKANGVKASTQKDLEGLDPDAGKGGKGPSSVPQTNGVFHPSSKDQYDLLPKGAHYIGRDGKTVMVKGG